MPIVQSSALVIVDSAASASVTLNNVTAGNALVVTFAGFLGSSPNTQFTFKDGSTALSVFDAFTPGGGYSVPAVAWELDVAAGSHTITIAGTASACYFDFVVHEVSGLGTTQPNVTISGTTTGTTLALAGATPTQADCIVFTALADDSNLAGSTAAATTPAGYTSLWSDMAGATDQIGAAAYQIQTAAAPVAPSWTGLNAAGGAGWAAVAVAFASASGVSASAAQTNGADVQVASATPQITVSAAQSNGADAQAASLALGTGISASAAQATTLPAQNAIAASIAYAYSTQADVTAQQNATATGGSVVPASVATHVLAWQPNPGTGSPVTTAAITTPARSLLLANVLLQTAGQFVSLTDSYGNTWVQVGTTQTYAGSAPTMLFKSVNAAGGANHTFSVNLAAGYTTDETSIMVTALNASDVGAWTFGNTGTFNSPNPLTTTANNSAVVCFFDAADYSGSTTASYTSPSGWTKLDQDPDGNNSDSCADAWIANPTMGAIYNPAWTSNDTLSSGAGVWLIEALASTTITADASGFQTIPAAAQSASASLTALAQAAQTGTQNQQAAVGVSVAVASAAQFTASAAQTAAAAGVGALLGAQQGTPTAQAAAAVSSITATGAQQNTAPQQSATASTSNVAYAAAVQITAPAQQQAIATSVASTSGAQAESAAAQQGSASSVSLANAAQQAIADLQSAMAATGNTVYASASQITLGANQSASATTTASASAAQSVPLNSQAAIAAAVAQATAQQLGQLAQQGASATVTISAQASQSGAIATQVAIAAVGSNYTASASQTAGIAQQIATAASAVYAQAAQQVSGDSQAAIAKINALFAFDLRGYAQQPAAYFYAPANAMTTPTFSAKHPTSSRVATFDASANLAPGETLTSILSQSVTLTRDNDANASAVVAASPAPSINSASVTVPTVGGNVTISAGCCVQCDVTGGFDGCWYLITFVCATSNPNKVLTLTAVLPVSVQP